MMNEKDEHHSKPWQGGKKGPASVSCARCHTKHQQLVTARVRQVLTCTGDQHPEAGTRIVGSAIVAEQEYKSNNNGTPPYPPLFMSLSPVRPIRCKNETMKGMNLQPAGLTRQSYSDSIHGLSVAVKTLFELSFFLSLRTQFFKTAGGPCLGPHTLPRRT